MSVSIVKSVFVWIISTSEEVGGAEVSHSGGWRTQRTQLKKLAEYGIGPV
jgi:hypothetical protein